MTKLLEDAIARVRELPAETQDVAAEALFMVIDQSNDEQHYHLTSDQIEGVKHAMGQADRGEFASDKEVGEIFGRSL